MLKIKAKCLRIYSLTSKAIILYARVHYSYVDMYQKSDLLNMVQFVYVFLLRTGQRTITNFAVIKAFLVDPWELSSTK